MMICSKSSTSDLNKSDKITYLINNICALENILNEYDFVSQWVYCYLRIICICIYIVDV